MSAPNIAGIPKTSEKLVFEQPQTDTGSATNPSSVLFDILNLEGMSYHTALRCTALHCTLLLLHFLSAAIHSDDVSPLDCVLWCCIQRSIRTCSVVTVRRYRAGVESMAVRPWVKRWSRRVERLTLTLSSTHCMRCSYDPETMTYRYCIRSMRFATVRPSVHAVYERFKRERTYS